MLTLFDDGSWILLVEMGIALILLIFIVWWTLPQTPPPPIDQHSDNTSRSP